MQTIFNYSDYLINQSGQIFSIKSKLWMKFSYRSGYLRVCLTKNNKAKHFSVHRLVAEAYIINSENKLYINHKDGNKQNNHISNLEWCTRSENIQHALLTGLIKPKRGKDNPNFGKKRPEQSLRQKGASNPSAIAVKCLNTQHIFATIKEAATWCNADSSALIRVCKKIPNRLGNPCLTAGKHPKTGEPLKWSYV